MLKRLLFGKGNNKKDGSVKVAVKRLKEDQEFTDKELLVLEKKRSVLKMCKRLCLLILFTLICSVGAFAQLADLDLLEENDRSVSASVSSIPNPVTGKYTESRSFIVLYPLRLGQQELRFEGGAGVYFSQVLAEGDLNSVFQWRVQGGPHYKWAGMQFYVEGFWRDSINYAGFVRFGEFDLGHVLLSSGFGSLVKAGTETDLGVGVERNAAGGDQVVKGLCLLSAEVDTPFFDSLRLLGKFLPGFDGQHDYIGEGQVSYAWRGINLVGFARFGYEGDVLTRQYTGLLQVPF